MLKEYVLHDRSILGTLCSYFVINLNLAQRPYLLNLKKKKFKKGEKSSVFKKIKNKLKGVQVLKLRVRFLPVLHMDFYDG